MYIIKAFHYAWHKTVSIKIFAFQFHRGFLPWIGSFVSDCPCAPWGISLTHAAITAQKYPRGLYYAHTPSSS